MNLFANHGFRYQDLSANRRGDEKAMYTTLTVQPLRKVL
jgi:hypothetical protein